eukprot:CAMPEP_0178986944 /NCGR_PEP_ID=MMETSP0795-20121207/2984_1 /TAXON_ID=88552 /ORGANISM="Amoebophrya sp., Strain Ameob2" /LENGTH=597 /DNA_ID=CAMNT_0020678059 /DNA_START=60 /DNA_END=1853 /DNA_ORIENTATION=-
MPTVASGPGGLNAPRPSNKLAGGGGKDQFYAGCQVEYYSKSAGGKWIPSVVREVQNDGSLVLNYPDGTILKEGADPSQVRKAGSSSSGGGSGGGGNNGGSAAARQENIRDVGVGGERDRDATPRLGGDGGGGGGGKPSGAGANNINRRPSGMPPTGGGGGAANGGGAGGNRPRRDSNFNANGGAGSRLNNGNVGNAGGRRPSSGIGGGGGVVGNRVGGAAAGGEMNLDGTWNQQKVYVGDRAKIRETGRSGDVMFVGRINSLGTGLTVGLKLDEKRRTSECDGRHGSERYFRCPPGYGVFLSIDEVEVVTKGTEKDSAASLENCKLVFEAPTDKEISLENELAVFYDSDVIKGNLRKVKHWVEVQRKRYEAACAQKNAGAEGGSAGAADIGLKPLTFLFRGQPGTGKTTIARHLTHLLRDLGVVNRGHLIETSRKELTASYGEGDKTVTKVWKSALGGVLLIDDIGNGADDKNDRSGGHTLEEALYSIMKHYDSMSRTFKAWPQQMCVILSYAQTASLPERLQPIQNDARPFDFEDYSDDCIARILESNIKNRNFSANIKFDSLLNVVRGAVARGMGRGAGDGFPNALLAEKLLNDA